MNLNDPFNRLSRQQQNEYLKFRDSLKENNVNTQVDAESLLANARRKALVASALLTIIAVFIVIFSPELKAIVFVLTLVILLWILSVTFKGQKFIRRYIAEEFSKNP